MPEKGRHVCSKCNRSYKYRYSLSSHQRNECGKEPRFFCPVEGCTFKTKLKGNWKQHIVAKHEKMATAFLNY